MYFFRLYAWIITLCRVGTGVFFGIQIIVVLTQVFARSFLAGSPVWTEEATRYALLFMAAFGVGLSFRNGELISVDIILNLLPKPVRNVMIFACAAVTAGFCLVLLQPAWMFMSIGRLQTSPSIGLRMDFVHVSVLVLLAILLFFAVARMLHVLVGVCDNKLESQSTEHP